MIPRPLVPIWTRPNRLGSRVTTKPKLKLPGVHVRRYSARSAPCVNILLVEDSQDDCDLALRALRRERLVNNIFIVRDGEEALSFLFCAGAYADRTFDQPPKL